MPDKYRVMTLTEFRADASRQLAWVEWMGGHVWITKHKKAIAAVIPFYQLKPLEELMTWQIPSWKKRQEQSLEDWLRAKRSVMEGGRRKN